MSSTFVRIENKYEINKITLKKIFFWFQVNPIPEEKVKKKFGRNIISHSFNEYIFNFFIISDDSIGIKSRYFLHVNLNWKKKKTKKDITYLRRIKENTIRSMNEQKEKRKRYYFYIEHYYYYYTSSFKNKLFSLTRMWERSSGDRKLKLI